MCTDLDMLSRDMLRGVKNERGLYLHTVVDERGRP